MKKGIGWGIFHAIIAIWMTTITIWSIGEGLYLAAILGSVAVFLNTFCSIKCFKEEL